MTALFLTADHLWTHRGQNDKIANLTVGATIPNVAVYIVVTQTHAAPKRATPCGAERYLSTEIDMDAHNPYEVNAAELNVNAGDSFFIRVGTQRIVVDVVDVQYRLQNLHKDYDRTFTASELSTLMQRRDSNGDKILEQL